MANETRQAGQSACNGIIPHHFNIANRKRILAEWSGMIHSDRHSKAPRQACWPRVRHRCSRSHSRRQQLARPGLQNRDTRARVGVSGNSGNSPKPADSRTRARMMGEKTRANGPQQCHQKRTSTVATGRKVALPWVVASRVKLAAQARTMATVAAGWAPPFPSRRGPPPGVVAHAARGKPKKTTLGSTPHCRITQASGQLAAIVGGTFRYIPAFRHVTLDRKTVTLAPARAREGPETR